MKTQILSMLVLFCVQTLTGCNYRNAKGDPGAPPSAKTSGAVPSFTELSATILAAKCFVCHNAQGRAGDLSSYAEFHANMLEAKSRLLDSGPGHMPLAGHPQLTSDELSTVIAWIDAGGPENGGSASPVVTPTPAPTPVAGLPSFDRLKTAVLNGKCFVCHDGASDPDAIDLRSYAAFAQHAKAAKRRVLLPLTAEGHMPESDHPQLSASELQLLVGWIDGGAPEHGTPPTSNALEAP